MLTKENLKLHFIESDELRGKVLEEININQRISDKKALTILGCLLINYILQGDKESIESIFMHMKVTNKVEHIAITLRRKYNGLYKSNNISNDEIITTIKEELFFALVDFKQNLFSIRENNNIEAAFFSYVNIRVENRVIATFEKLYHNKHQIVADSVSNSSVRWEQESNYLEVLIDERLIREELKHYLSLLTSLEREVILCTVVNKVRYEELENIYNINRSTLRKKKERGLNKLKNKIAKGSILREIV